MFGNLRTCMVYLSNILNPTAWLTPTTPNQPPYYILNTTGPPIQ